MKTPQWKRIISSYARNAAAILGAYGDKTAKRAAKDFEKLAKKYGC